MRSVVPWSAALLVLLAGCGDGSSRSKLEDALAEGGKTICDGDCKSFHATGATCAGRGTLVDSKRFYRCRVDYDNGGAPDRVCAALSGSNAVVRPMRTCRR